MPDPTPRLGYSREDIASIAKEGLAGMVAWKTLIGILVVIAGALGTIGGISLAAAGDADDAKRAVKAVHAECKLGEARCKESAFPRVDGEVLRTRLEHVIEEQTKMDKKLDKILEAVSK